MCVCIYVYIPGVHAVLLQDLRGHLHGRHLSQQIPRTVRKEMVRLKERRPVTPLGIEDGILASCFFFFCVCVCVWLDMACVIE